MRGSVCWPQTGVTLMRWESTTSLEDCVWLLCAGTRFWFLFSSLDCLRGQHCAIWRLKWGSVSVTLWKREWLRTYCFSLPSMVPLTPGNLTPIQQQLKTNLSPFHCLSEDTNQDKRDFDFLQILPSLSFCHPFLILDFQLIAHKKIWQILHLFSLTAFFIYIYKGETGSKPIL